jgi:hypothetical protein
MKKINLDQLGQYSPWVKILLGIEKPKKDLSKTKDKVTAEYNIDKWGTLLTHIKSSSNIEIEDADSFFLENHRDDAFYVNGELYAARRADIQKIYLDIIAKELQKYRTDQIVELGAGYGHVILNIAKDELLRNTEFIACEYTDSGISCMELILERRRSKNIRTGFCDLEDLQLNNLGIKDKAIFFTAYTMPCIKGFPMQIVEHLRQFNPRRVIHFEPVFDHWDEGSLLNLMWMSYAKTNDYNITMLQELKVLEQSGYVKICREERNIFGSHALFPISIVEWMPV